MQNNSCIIIEGVVRHLAFVCEGAASKNNKREVSDNAIINVATWRKRCRKIDSRKTKRHAVGATVKAVNEIEGNIIIEVKGSRLAMNKIMANRIILDV